MIKPREHISKLNYYPVPLYEEPGYWRLDANENDIGCSKKVLNALKKITKEKLANYPYYGKMIDLLAGFHKVNSGNIILTNGADEAIYLPILAYLNPGEKVLSVTPAFSMPKIHTGICCGEYVEVPYKEKWKFPVEDFLNQITDEVKIIVLTSPNNPTGELLPREILEKILEKANDKVVLIDETYANYAFTSYANLVNTHDNIFVLRSFSKDHGLAGLRLGYILSNKENIDNLKKLANPYNVNTLAILAGIEAVKDFENFRRVRLEINKGKKLLKHALTDFGAKVYKSDTNFLCVDFGKRGDYIKNLLLENKIKIKDLTSNPMLSGTYRITIPSMKKVKKLIKILTPKPLIIFDMDGVLVDTSMSYRIAVQKTFEHFSGFDISQNEVQTAKNQGGLNNDWDLTEYLLKSHEFYIEKQKIIDKFQELYWNDGNGLINREKLLIKAKTLKKLQKKYNLAIFTGRPRLEAEFTLEKFGIKNYFKTLITMNDLPADRQKPDTLGISIINEFISNSKIVYLGDTTDDMICAKNANVIGLGVLPPQDKSMFLTSKLKSNGAVKVLNNVNDILKEVKKLV